jgi:hypothetical protein
MGEKAVFFALVMMLAFAIGHAQQPESGNPGELQKPPLALRVDRSSGDMRAEMNSEPASAVELAPQEESGQSAQYVPPAQTQ